ncbi:hypothetical protein ACQ7BN_08580 [Streptococcus suis]|uniref:hypothetical protein n=1 Tax=Streptococcus suis TaxID=1307 RepID=UPI002A7CF233|nr:hypothetical protein [Streptococcus suis]
MKKTHITLATVAALAAAVVVAPTAQADVQSKLDNIKGVVKISVEAQLNKNLADASAQNATAKANLTTAEATVTTKKAELATAQKAEQNGVKQIDEATATALKDEEKKVAAAKDAVTATEKLIAAEKEKIVAAQAKIKELNLVGGLTGKAAEIATEEAAIAAAEANIVTLNTQLEADTQAVADAEADLVTWKEERAKLDAAAKKVFADATAKAQKALTAAETEVSEWKVVVETLNKEVEAAKLELIKNGLTDAQIAQIIADAQAQVKVDTVATSVYRLYNSGLKVHLYTTDANEYAVLAERGWSQEGVAFKSAKEGTPVYRLYNEGLKVHLYTTDANEYAVLAGRGWRQEGVAFNSVKEGKPVYRLYNEGLKKHLYTTDANEYKVLATRGWTQEGVAFNSAN